MGRFDSLLARAALALLIASTASATAAVFTGPVTDVDGTSPDHVQFPYQEAAVSFRPFAADQKNLLVENYHIHDTTNQKGLDIRATRFDDAPAWAYNTITIRNLQLNDINRREDLPGGNGLHIDHIRIAGGGNNQDVKTNVLIENVEIDGGDALPILITDGTYGTITIRNVSIKNTTLNNIQFKTNRVGSIDKILIENSPDIGVALMSREGSVGDVQVINSPGVRLSEFFDTGAALASYVPSSNNYGSSLSIDSVPEPAGLSVFGLAAALLLRRRR